MMFGALYGDVIGSYYEVHSTKDHDFPFMRESTFTDDSVMTAAVCRTVIDEPAEITSSGLKERAKQYAVNYKQFYSYYPHAGYGKMFSDWASERGMMRRQKSFGNGGAMRACPIGYAYKDMEQVLLQAKASCLYTHSHPEGIKGAQAVAAAVRLALDGAGKSDIRSFIAGKFGYDLSHTVNDLRPFVRFDSSAQGSVPLALIAFLDSEDYESAVRNAVSLGGDADTLACIAGGIAEAFYGEIPPHMKKFCDIRLDSTIRLTVNEFEKNFKKI